MLKILFLALAVVVLLPPSVPACAPDKVNLCIDTEEHALHLLGSLILTGDIKVGLLDLVTATIKVKGFGQVEKIHTNDDGSISIYLHVLLDVDIYSPLGTADGVLRVIITMTGAIADGVYGILVTNAKVIIDYLNVNFIGIPINIEQFKLDIILIVEAAIAKHRDGYKKYLQDCFNLHEACTGGK